MRIVDAVHPLLEQNIHQTVPIPNNIVNQFGISMILFGRNYFIIITNFSNEIPDSNT